MSPLPSTRRSQWAPGLLRLAVAGAVAASLGLSFGARRAPLYVGIGIAALLLLGWLESLRERRAVSRPPRPRGRLRVIRGGRSEIDLAADESHKDQKYLM